MAKYEATAVYADPPQELRVKILGEYLKVSAARMRSLDLEVATQVKILSYGVAALVFGIPYSEVLVTTAKSGMVAVRSLPEIQLLGTSIEPKHVVHIRHLHLSKGFEVPVPTSLSYKSKLRIRSLSCLFPNLELITLDGAVSMPTWARPACLEISGRFKMY